MKVELELAALAAHLRARRPAILAAWSRSAQADPKLTTSATLSRTQFYDRIPNMLDALEQRLRSTDLRERLDATQEETTNAQGHGLQRWQQGYNEQEVMREWVWTNACLSDELALYAAAHPELAPQVMSSAWRLTADFLVTGMSESVAQYARVQRAEASARLQALEDAHQQLAALEQQRAEAWREATHDLRGNLSIVQYTQQGGIKITWERADSSPERWMLCVQDSGPGLGTQATAPISVALDAATRDMQQIEKSATSVGAGGDDPDRAATLASRSSPRVDQPREGTAWPLSSGCANCSTPASSCRLSPAKARRFVSRFPLVTRKGDRGASVGQGLQRFGPDYRQAPERRNRRLAAVRLRRRARSRGSGDSSHDRAPSGLGSAISAQARS